MSPSLTDRLRCARDDGFSLVEILVAITLLGILGAASLPLLISASGAAVVAEKNTQGKNLGQQTIDGIRNLPFHVNKRNGDFRDVFDTYFPAIVPVASGPQGAGYVPVAGVRQAWEPTVGAFYRQVTDPVAGYPGFRQEVTVQFLTAERAPVIPPAGYDNAAASAGSDALPSSYASITVVTSWPRGDRRSQHVLRTLLSDSSPPAPLVAVQAKATALTVSSVAAGKDLTAELAAVTADTALSTGFLSAYRAKAAVIDHRDTGFVEGAEVVRNAEAGNQADGAAVTATHVVAGSSTCDYACVSRSTSSRTLVELNALTRLPQVGSATSPAFTALRTSGGGPYKPVQYSNALVSARRPELQLSSTSPMISVQDAAAPCTAGPSDAGVCATARANAQLSPAAVVSAVATMRSSTIELFPTDFAPAGLIRITFPRAASVSCVTSAPSPVVDYEVIVQYRTPGGSYASVTARSSDTSDLLAAVPLGTMVNAAGRTLADYVQGWSSRPVISRTQLPNRSSVADVPGIVSITTRPTTADATSTISLSVGRLSCSAEDGR